MYTVDDYIARQPVYAQQWLQVLRKLILDTSPHVQESIKYGIPFYTYHGLLCYLNPQEDYVDFGFCRGTMLADETGLLYGDGKEVRKVKVTNLNDSVMRTLQQMVHEALLINEWQSQVPKNKLNNDHFHQSKLT